MLNLWIDKYRPKTLDDYVGDQYQTLLYHLDLFFKGERGKGFILYGKPGVGKSALINVIGNHYKADIYIINASDERNGVDIDAINTTSLINNKRVIIIEEFDGFNKQKFKELSQIIEICKNPIIFICNEINLIDDIVKSKCFIKEIKVNRFELKNLATKIIENEKLDISNNQLNDALKSIKSYRELFNFLQFKNISEMGSFTKSENLKGEITFISDNSEDPKLISFADIFLKRSQLGYKNGDKISKYILDNIDKTSNNYPRTYKLIYEAKNKKQNRGRIKILGFK